MNEHGYIRSVNKFVDFSYYWKINDSNRPGTPDSFYEGLFSDLWVEYKYLRDVPKRPNTLIHFTKRTPKGFGVSKKQAAWLKRRHATRKDAWVIIGSPYGSVFFRDLGWENPMPTVTFLQHCITPMELGTIISTKLNSINPLASGILKQ